jgi:phosphoribosylcarboxyaminoimidazole (NCAIR) mutase
MQIPADKIIRLTGPEYPSEVRSAAVTVLGELGGRDAAVNAAVLAAEVVGVSDPDVQKRLWRFKDDLAEGLRL